MHVSGKCTHGALDHIHELKTKFEKIFSLSLYFTTQCNEKVPQTSHELKTAQSLNKL